jgi:hypothetical protein
MVTDAEFDPPALVALHVRVVPLVSVLMVVGPHPVMDVTVDSLSTTLQLTLTSLVYHPLLPSVPTTFGVITGGVVSAGASTCEVKAASEVLYAPGPESITLTVMGKSPAEVAVNVVD